MMLKTRFHDAVGNLSVANGVARLDFYDEAPSPETAGRTAGQPGSTDQNAPHYMLAQRVAMPIPALVQLYAMFGEVMIQLEKQGLISRTPMSPDAPGAATPGAEERLAAERGTKA